ncbi:hypothetical protein F5Y11DRAFT_334550 [Daldinia sp. FL1419]|nr:hypothetical protein F5Y11DRAFT_334550 [Daldinia sp. FL1419]
MGLFLLSPIFLGAIGQFHQGILYANVYVYTYLGMYVCPELRPTRHQFCFRAEASVGLTRKSESKRANRIPFFPFSLLLLILFSSLVRAAGTPFRASSLRSISKRPPMLARVPTERTETLQQLLFPLPGSRPKI